jgi:2-methylcitrate dehydratase PrpD
MSDSIPLEAIAEWASRVASADIPADQHRRARLRLLDTVGLIAAAAAHPAGKSLVAWSERNAGAGATVLVSGEEAAPMVAALVHGSLAHARDFDDTFPDTLVHPGSTVIAAALAAGERANADLADLTAAIVVGYEIAARLGAAAGRRFHARGFHATSIVGPIAAAGAAARILALDASQTADALGLATSMSGGLLAFLADGGWSKWLHTGWAAHGGVVAAEIASLGFRGPRRALDHHYGLYAAFLGAETDLAMLTEGLGQRWLGSAAQPKYFPCAHVIQPYIEAVLALRAGGRRTGETVQSVRCTVAPWALPIVGEPRAIKIAPRNDLEAIASLPFMVAAALCDGRVDLETLGPDSLARADVRVVAERVACEADDRLGAGFDGRIELTAADGERISRPVALSAWSEQRLIEKFRANTAHLPPTACALLENALLHDEPNTRTLVRLAAATTAGREAAAP